MTIWYILSVVLLILGFGFVIFWHELGHFIAAKAVGIKVEQFAVGFGQAILSWRKGLGLQLGSSGKRYDELVRSGAADGISETEYRLNWVPLGGYVKMLGQDDLKPNATADDPRAFNKKSIGARMIVVSAGVIMNIILAAIGFMILFMIGFNAPPTVVGKVVPGSPAALAVKNVNGQTVQAPLQVGDRILYLDDQYQHDFTKVPLTVALSEPGVPIPAYVERTNGEREHLSIAPAKMGRDSSSFLGIGIEPVGELRGLEKETYEATKKASGDPSLYSPDVFAVRPGEVITEVNDRPIVPPDEGKPAHQNYAQFHEALQESLGKPVTLTVVDQSGASRKVDVHPVLPNIAFGEQSVNIAGLQPRAAVDSILLESAAKDKLLPGDEFVSITAAGGKQVTNPSTETLTKVLSQAGAANQAVDVVVLRDGEEMAFNGIVPNIPLENGRKGLGVGLRPTHETVVVAEVGEKSPAAAAGIPAGALIQSVDGKAVSNWFEVAHLIATAPPAQDVKLTAELADGETKEFTLKLTSGERAEVASVQATHEMLLHERVEPRVAPNALVAAGWGVTETRDFVLQFYLTLKRMVTGDVSYKNMMGPVGIVHAGAKFAFKGGDWLLWFLSMISANLAVVNFLPIPIVDGGLFLFLIIEKIQGRPLSAKTQSIAQVVGLALILSIFLLVTYQDIARML